MTSLGHTGRLALASVLLLAACSPRRPEGEALGKQLFQNCAFCHGEQGQGNEELAAPAIAGLSQWYVEAQLQKFRLGARGDHPDDVAGLKMRAMARTLVDEEEVAAVAALVANMPPQRPAPSLVGGNAVHGRELFTPCVQCHGPAAEGNQALSAPPLAGASDWYLAAQLAKFREGIRGADAEDTTGAQMRPMAASLGDEQAIKDVVAHIATLAP